MTSKIEAGFIVGILITVLLILFCLIWYRVEYEQNGVGTYTFSNLAFTYPGAWKRNKSIRAGLGTKTRHDLSYYTMQIFSRKPSSSVSGYSIIFFKFDEKSPRDLGVVPLPLELRSEEFLEYLYNEFSGHSGEITTRMTIANQIPAYHKEFFYPRIENFADLVIFTNNDVKYGLLTWNKTDGDSPTIQDIIDNIHFVGTSP